MLPTAMAVGKGVYTPLAWVFLAFLYALIILVDTEKGKKRPMVFLRITVLCHSKKTSPKA